MCQRVCMMTRLALGFSGALKSLMQLAPQTARKIIPSRGNRREEAQSKSFDLRGAKFSIEQSRLTAEEMETPVSTLQIGDRIALRLISRDPADRHRAWLVASVAHSMNYLVRDGDDADELDTTIAELRETIGIVIVTHNMQQAARCSDRTAFFYLGKLVEYADTRDIFTNPSNPQTEAYVSGRFG
mgnify:CR=1 FL=1